MGSVRRGALVASLATLPILIVAILAACPAAGGNGVGPGGWTGQPYLCANGSASSLRDATVDGISRCVSCDHPQFFVLEGSSNAIGTTCQTATEVGGAIQIDRVHQFGVSEDLPHDLAAIGDTLYMVGRSNDVLYTLDTATGRATQVSDPSVNDFGVGEDNPIGLAAIDSTLYMVGWNQRFLYTLNIGVGDGTPDGTAIQVGSAPDGFGVGEYAPTGLAAIGNTLYMVGTTNNALYTLDTVSGRATLVSDPSVTDFGVSEDIPTGLASIGNNLYMAGQSNGVLYTLNIDPDDTTPDGMAIQVSNMSVDFDVSENRPSGLAAIGNTLYMVGTTNDTLYAIRYQ